MAKTVIVKGLNFTRKESIASEAITPGMFVERVVGAGATTVQKRTVVVLSNNLVAMENEVVGNDIDTAYATGDTILLVAPCSGTELNVVLATSMTIVTGDEIELVTGGLVQKQASGAIVGIALEDVTTTGAVGRLRIELA